MAKLLLSKENCSGESIFQTLYSIKTFGVEGRGDRITPEPRGGSSRFYRDKTTLQHTPKPPPLRH